MQQNDKQLGIWFTNNVMLDRARFHLSEHLKANPSDYYIHGVLIWTFSIERQEIESEMLGKWYRCDKFYEEQDLKQTDTIALIIKFYQAYNDEEYQSVIETVEELKTAGISFADLEYTLSKTYSKLNNETESKKHLLATLEIDPENLPALKNLAQTEYINKNYFRALEYVKVFKNLDIEILKKKYLDADSLIGKLKSIDYMIGIFYGNVYEHSLAEEHSLEKRKTARIMLQVSAANESIAQIWVASIFYHNMNNLDLSTRLFRYYFDNGSPQERFVNILENYLGEKENLEERISQLDEMINEEQGPLWLLYLYRGLHKAKLKDEDGYFSDIQQSYVENPKNVTTIYEYISIEKNNQNWEKVLALSSLTVEDFLDAVYSNPYAWGDLNYILKSRLEALYALGKTDEILTCLETFEVLFETGGEGFYLKGTLILAEMKEYTKSLHFLEKALTINENVLSSMAEDDIEVIKKLQEAFPKAYFPKYAVALSTAIHISVEQAFGLMRSVHSEFPHKVNPICHFAALTEIVEEDNLTALNLFTKALEINPESDPALSGIAEIKLAADKEEDVFQLANTYPSFPGAFTPLIQHAIESEDKEKIINTFRFLLKHHPDHFAPNMYLFSVLDGGEEIEYGEKLFEIATEDLHLTRFLADHHFSNANFLKAEKYYSELASLTRSTTYLNKAAIAALLVENAAQ